MSLESPKAHKGILNKRISDEICFHTKPMRTRCLKAAVLTMDVSLLDSLLAKLVD